MKIDGKTVEETDEVSQHLKDAWNNLHSIITQSQEVFNELTCGPDCVQIDDYHVHDRGGVTPVFLRPGPNEPVTDIAYRPLFKAASQLSHLPKIDWYEERWHHIIIALKCAAAISDENGHDDQAQTFREIYMEMEDDVCIVD